MMKQHKPSYSTDQMTAHLRMLGTLVGLLVLTALVGISGCAAVGTDADQIKLQNGPGVTTLNGNGEMEYRIGPSDVLSISVWNHKELNQTVTVRPDGQVSFSLVGDILAAGLTPVQLQLAIEEAMGKYINIIPGEVSVVVDAVHSYKVSVLGEVHLPGRFEFQNQASVLDALAQAGGLTEFASSSNIMILRTNHGKTEKIRFDYRRLLKSESSADRVLIFPGDVILVP